MYLYKNGVHIGDSVDFYWFQAGFVTAFFPGIASMQSNWRFGDVPVEKVLDRIE